MVEPTITKTHIGNPFNTHETIVLFAVHHHRKVKDTPEALAEATKHGGHILTPNEAKQARDALHNAGWLGTCLYADGSYLIDRNPAWTD